MDSMASNVPVQALQTQTVGPSFGQAFSDINALAPYGAIGTNVLPSAYQTYSNLYNNPYATTAQTGANAASALGSNAAMTGYNVGAGLTGAGQSLIPYATQIMNTGFDPQQQLYNQQFALNHQTGAVNNAQAGVATTPYGAGLQNQNDQNFNINWQNQQLAREAQAAGAAGGLVSTGANVAGQGVNMQNAAPQQLVQSATIPYATYTDIGTGQNQAIQQLLGIGGQGANLSNMSVQDLLNYIGAQNQTNQVGNQTSQTGLNQSNSTFNQIGTLASSAAGLLGSFLPFNSGGYTGTFGGTSGYSGPGYVSDNALY